MSDTFTDSWSVAGHDGGTLVDPSKLLVSSALAKSYLNETGVESDDPLLALIITAACDYVEQAAGPVMPTSYVERHDGWGGETIMLRHTPVLSVAYVIEYRSTGGPLTLPESTPTNSVEGYQLDHRIGEVIRVFQGNWPRTFFPGSQNIEVSYTAGYSTPPATITQAALELIAHWWRQGHQDRTVDYGPDGGYDNVQTTPGAWAAVPYRIQDKLRALRQPRLG